MSSLSSSRDKKEPEKEWEKREKSHADVKLNVIKWKIQDGTGDVE